MTRTLGLLTRPNTTRGSIEGVPRDDEFIRIDALPRRRWTKAQAKRAVSDLTQKLRTPDGQRELWADQAIALTEIGWYGGTVCGIRVSGGKTLISFLAGTMLPGVQKPLLISPSKSIRTGKVARAYDEEREHWKVRDDYAWISYNHLQQRKHADYLFIHKPGIIILDEAHHAGRYKSSRTNRIARYLAANPEVYCIVLTGSLIASRVVNDSLTLLSWARREASPLPHPKANNTQRFWKMALDTPQRGKPGALRAWCNPNEPTLSGVGRRYVETPGIVCSAGDNVVGTSLVCTTELIPDLPPAVLQAYEYVRSGRSPDGAELIDADGGNSWLHAQTLALGYYRVYDPPPPTDWLDAKRNWSAYCREHIQSAECQCDTERQAKDHILLDGSECWPLHEWLDIRHKYDIQHKTVWLSRARLDAAKRWMHGHRHGIVWTQFPTFGTALASHARAPYYGAQARDRDSRQYITQHKRGTPCIASIKVCSEDLNLQHTFYENLYPTPPGTGAWHEQTIARTHRFGQPEPEVTAHYWVACAENRDALSIAIAREKAAAQMLQDNSRKLLLAEWLPHKRIKVQGAQWKTIKIAKSLMK